MIPSDLPAAPAAAKPALGKSAVKPVAPAEAAAALPEGEAFARLLAEAEGEAGQGAGEKPGVGDKALPEPGEAVEPAEARTDAPAPPAELLVPPLVPSLAAPLTLAAASVGAAAPGPAEAAAPVEAGAAPGGVSVPAPPSGAGAATPAAAVAQAPQPALDAPAIAEAVEPEAEPEVAAAIAERPAAKAARPAPAAAPASAPVLGDLGTLAAPAAAWRLAPAAAHPLEAAHAPRAAPRPEPVAEQIAVAVAGAVEPEVELRLDPPELGRVQIRLTHGEAGLQAVVLADRPETQDFLRRHAETLQRELTEAGYAQVSLEFAAGEDAAPRDRAEEARRLFAAAGNEAPARGPGPAVPRAAALPAGLDIRL